MKCSPSSSRKPSHCATTFQWSTLMWIEYSLYIFCVVFQTKDNPPQSSRLIESVCPCGCLFVLFSWPALVKFRKVRLSYTLRMQSLETNVTRKAFPLNPRTSIVRGFDKKQILHEKYTFFLCMSKILKHTLNILSASNLNAFVSYC